MPSKMRKRGSYLPGPQLRYGSLSVIAGDSAMIAPGFSVVFAHPSQTFADAGRERIVDGRVAQSAR